MKHIIIILLIINTIQYNMNITVNIIKYYQWCGIVCVFA